MQKNVSWGSSSPSSRGYQQPNDPNANEAESGCTRLPSHQMLGCTGELRPMKCIFGNCIAQGCGLKVFAHCTALSLHMTEVCSDTNVEEASQSFLSYVMPILQAPPIGSTKWGEVTAANIEGRPSNKCLGVDSTSRCLSVSSGRNRHHHVPGSAKISGSDHRAHGHSLTFAI